MKIEIYIVSILFILLTCGLWFISKNLESFDNQEVITYLDASCNTILKDSDTPSEDTPMYLIQYDKCINMNDYQE